MCVLVWDIWEIWIGLEWGIFVEGLECQDQVLGAQPDRQWESRGHLSVDVKWSDTWIPHCAEACFSFP